MDSDIKVFSLSGNVELVNEICDYLKIEPGKIEVNHFADGETLVEFGESVRGKQVYFVQSTYKPVNERLMELLIAIDAAKRASASEIQCIIPYFGYARQDRVALKGEPISAKVVANLYQAVGIRKIITLDLHTQQIQGFFSCPVENLDTFEIFGNYFVDYFNKIGVKQTDVVVVAPDHGSALRARDLGSMFNGASLAFIDKRRPGPNKSEVINVVGDVKGKHCIIVDDMIDTCGTTNNAYDALKEHGAKEVYACATHSVFSSGVLKKEIKHVVVTDSIERKIEGVNVISVASLIAEAIKND